MAIFLQIYLVVHLMVSCNSVFLGQIAGVPSRKDVRFRAFLAPNELFSGYFMPNIPINRDI